MASHSFPADVRPQTLVQRARDAVRDLGSVESNLRLSVIVEEFKGDPEWRSIADAATDIADGWVDAVADFLDQCAEFDRDQDARERHERWQARHDPMGNVTFADWREGFHRTVRPETFNDYPRWW